MEPANFEGSTNVLGAPEGMTADEVRPLYVARGNMDGCPVVISCWKPTRAELDEIGRTGRVWLTVMGSSMPPVIIGAERPFEPAST